MAAALFIAGFGLIVLLVPWLLARDTWSSAPMHAAPDAGRGADAPLFTSRREQLLWLWAAVALLVIYSTLGVVQRPAAWLRARDLLELAIAGIIGLAGVALVAWWLRTRPARQEIGIGIGVIAVLLMALSRATLPERTHLFEYGVVAALIHHALIERRRNGRRVLVPPVIAVIATALLGWLDEGLQALLPQRVYDARDVGFNALAGVITVSLSTLMLWVRRRWSPRAPRSPT